MHQLPKNHPKLKLHKYEGILEFYYETGFENQAAIFHDNRGNHEAPSWDNPEKMMTYRSLSWGIFFNKHGLYNAVIYNKKNNIVYKGRLSFDIEKMKKSKYSISFFPKEMSEKRWLKYVSGEYRTVLYTNEITEAIAKEYDLKFRIGETVNDDLTGKEAIIINITLGENKTIGYWLNNDHADGGRHPWEITKIDWIKKWKQQNG